MIRGKGFGYAQIEIINDANLIPLKIGQLNFCKLIFISAQKYKNTINWNRSSLQIQMNFPGQGYSTGGYPPPQPQTYGSGYPPQQPGYPPQQPGYPPQQSGYPPQQTGYPPHQNGYPPQQQGYPPQVGYPGQGYPSSQQPASPYGGYPPQQPLASPYGSYPPPQQQQQTSFDRNVSGPCQAMFDSIYLNNSHRSHRLIHLKFRILCSCQVIQVLCKLIIHSRLIQCITNHPIQVKRQLKINRLSLIIIHSALWPTTIKSK